jgi:uncharacterized protein YacL
MPYIAVGVLVLIIVGIVAILALRMLRPGDAAASSRQAGTSTTASLGMSIGLLLGGLLGALVWISTGQFVFWVVFVGGGLSTGLAIGTALASRSR